MANEKPTITEIKNVLARRGIKVTTASTKVNERVAYKIDGEPGLYTRQYLCELAYGFI